MASIVIVLQGHTFNTAYASSPDCRVFVVDYDNEPDTDLSDLLELTGCEFQINPE